MMSAQLVSIVVMFISGIAVGIVIDATRILVRQASIKWIRHLASVIEWCVWLFLASSTFYLLFLVKGGQWRLVDPLAQILGIVSYELIFQNITRFVGSVIVNIFIKPFYYIGHIFVLFIRKIIKILMGFCHFITNSIFKFLKKKL